MVNNRKSSVFSLKKKRQKQNTFSMTTTIASFNLVTLINLTRDKYKCKLSEYS